MSTKNKIQSHFASLHSTSTAAKYWSIWQTFQEYLEQLSIPVQQVDYSIILDYVHQMQQRGLKGSSINKQLVVLEKAYESLELESPTRGLRVKREGEQALHEPLKASDLETVVRNYPNQSPKEHRNKVILSLLYHQALKTAELQALQVEHIDLEKAILFIPSTGKSQSRELLLEAKQIRLLESYLEKSRPQLQQFATSQLLLTGGSSKSIKALLQLLLKQVQKQLPQLKNLSHWRSSMLVHWLEHQPLLEVQKKAGHQFASSTEKYQLQAVNKLQKALDKFHPLSQLESPYD